MNAHASPTAAFVHQSGDRRRIFVGIALGAGLALALSDAGRRDELLAIVLMVLLGLPLLALQGIFAFLDLRKQRQRHPYVLQAMWLPLVVGLAAYPLSSIERQLKSNLYSQGEDEPAYAAAATAAEPITLPIYESDGLRVTLSPLNTLTETLDIEHRNTQPLLEFDGETLAWFSLVDAGAVRGVSRDMDISDAIALSKGVLVLGTKTGAQPQVQLLHAWVSDGKLHADIIKTDDAIKSTRFLHSRASGSTRLGTEKGQILITLAPLKIHALPPGLWMDSRDEVAFLGTPKTQGLAARLLLEAVDIPSGKVLATLSVSDACTALPKLETSAENVSDDEAITFSDWPDWLSSHVQWVRQPRPSLTRRVVNDAVSPSAKPECQSNP